MKIALALSTIRNATLHDSRFTLHSSRFTLHSSRSTFSFYSPRLLERGRG
ncbi:MAG: hypothetical protein J6T52_10015 [Bacteroidaceae bacterium]|nr:hypothetical protein [Bacteroidaceae bacterium]